jgi:hypothetical protein
LENRHLSYIYLESALFLGIHFILKCKYFRIHKG